MTLYSTFQKKTFQLIHCWTELRNCPKFSSTLEKKTRKSPLESPVASTSAQSQFIGTPAQESEERMERPMGKKAAKRLKKSEHDANDVEFITALTQVKDTVSKLSEARYEKIQQMIELEKERFKAAEEREKAREERDKRMYEMSILGIDTSTMEAPLAKYYKSLKADILKKRI
ncbi:hypothetical protein POM88_050606 [Heracleum sosnowskyi]|uniref:No apical meristem-associated C-terminal domain-containing protein n=1 Tax=Heracleum sosnowskyi TaxID=360622 RepID=A0AAD8GXY8_9APIA|nr:hypothetical protein POM88_050606 [Heracleum sosnowskyi]